MSRELTIKHMETLQAMAAAGESGDLSELLSKLRFMTMKHFGHLMKDEDVYMGIPENFDWEQARFDFGVADVRCCQDG